MRTVGAASASKAAIRSPSRVIGAGSSASSLGAVVAQVGQAVVRRAQDLAAPLTTTAVTPGRASASARRARSAASTASGSPASAWRTMPMPGSAVSTRRIRSPASGVPSATHTCPAWIESPMPDAAAVVDRDPGGAAGDVDHRVEQRPVGHRVGAVAHRLGLALGRGDRAGVEVVAADHDRRAQLAAGHHLVEAQPGEVALAVAQPADPRRQPLEVHALARQRDPARDVLLVAEEVEDRVVGGVDVGRVARQRHPAERALALAEQRADVGGDEARIGERVRVAVGRGQPAQRVAVVERLGAGRLQHADRGDVRDHALADAAQVVVGVGGAQRVGLLDGQPGGDVAVERVVGARLVGDDVDRRAAAHELGQHLGGVAEQADRQRLAPAARGVEAAQRVVEVGRALVEVAGLDPALDALQVDLDAQRAAVVHRHRQRLRAAHAAEPGGHHEPAGERAAEALARDRRERLVGALQDPLGPDVDPGPGRHLAVHHQPGGVELAEVLPGRPLRHEVRVGDQHARRVRVRLEHRHRLARLHEQRLVAARGAGARA